MRSLALLALLSSPALASQMVCQLVAPPSKVLAEQAIAPEGPDGIATFSTQHEIESGVHKGLKMDVNAWMTIDEAKKRYNLFLSVTRGGDAGQATIFAEGGALVRALPATVSAQGYYAASGDEDSFFASRYELRCFKK